MATAKDLNEIDEFAFMGNIWTMEPSNHEKIKKDRES